MKVNSYNYDIQGLRALAVIFVIVFHLNNTLLVGGFLGVDIFFVISGYLMSEIIVRQKEESRFSWLNFISSRAIRIIPAYATMLLVASIASAILMLQYDFGTFTRSFSEAVSFRSNLYFKDYYDYFGVSAFELPLLHTWSLSVEMQFYILITIFSGFLIKFYARYVVLLFIIIFTLASFLDYTFFRSDEVYYLLYPRMSEFLCGSLVSMLKHSTGWQKNIANKIQLVPFQRFISGALPWLGSTLILLSVILMQDSYYVPVVSSIPTVLGTSLILLTKGSYVHRFLSGRFLVFIGNISFSLYLFHWPILAAIRYVIQTDRMAILQSFIFIFILLVLSIASYYFVENPFRKIKAVKYKFITIFSILLLLTYSENLFVYVNANLAPTPSLSLSRYGDQSTLCHSQMVGDCVRGSENGMKHILLLGDSHAAQLNLTADVIGLESNVRFSVITASSCVNIPGFDARRIDPASYDACIGQIEQVRHMFTEVDGIIIGGKWTSHMRSEIFRGALQEFLNGLNQNKVPTMVLGQVPELDRNPQRLFRFSYLGWSQSANTIALWDYYNKEVELIADAYENVSFFNPSEMPLFHDAPFFDGQMVYYDSHHLNEVGANLYAIQASDIFADWINSIR